MGIWWERIRWAIRLQYDSKFGITFFFQKWWRSGWRCFSDLNIYLCVCVCVHIWGLVAKSCPVLATPWTVAHHAPPSMGSSRQEYRSRLPYHTPGNLSGPEMEPGSPALQADSLPTELPGNYAMNNQSEVNLKEISIHALNPETLFITAHSHRASHFFKDSSCVLLWIRHVFLFSWESWRQNSDLLRIIQLSQRRRRNETDPGVSQLGCTSYVTILPSSPLDSATLAEEMPNNNLHPVF